MPSKRLGRSQIRNRRGQPGHSSLTRCAVVLIALGTLTIGTAASAAEQSAARKIRRGFAGLITGVLEIPGNIVEETRINGLLSGATVGLGTGLGLFLSRELIGAYEVLSSPFALPAGFEPIMAPEYPWQYFDTTSGDHFDRQAREIARIPGARVERRGKAIVVSFPNDLLFESGSSTLSLAANRRLDSVGRAMRRYPNTSIAVTGHADSTGEEDLNLAISERRAASVRRYLIRGGVISARVTTTGEGEARPFASNATAPGRQRNRRVEIRLESSGVAVGAR